ncbi:2-oxo-4-hydroxy-4-carboxy-5-ureidoimidazoline decarboxylase [Nocardioides ferulae]|uniref:2-oxo-4-hydroxy-4-carboxy-5-ureidoimidazoline decarboxylase n=1 Tax=Nocardioides ferulae TaxID=2340821 RepID=UPI000EB1D598|nr:2-oxo-4-hydroxy-4-carboxy-5-ureidoimidazoline decarboxylase [Nocardioides ferulae]
MLIEEFNRLDAEAAAAVVRPCADVDAWVAAIVAARPFDSVDELTGYAEQAASAWTGEEVEAALADHPRIGERPRGSGASAGMSVQEQAGVDRDDDDLARRLAEGNRRYEKLFGRIFLVRAAGRDAAEILALLEQRLDNDEETELRVTAGELAEIAVLRLRGQFA